MISVNFNEDSLRAMIMEAVKDVLGTVTQPQSPVSDEKPLNVKEASEFLGMAIPTVYNNVSKGIIPHMKRGKFLYFSKIELADYLKQGKRRTITELLNEK